MKKKILIILIISFVIPVVHSLVASSESYEGDFIVKSGETLSIKNKTLEVDGDFILNNGSTLIMEDAVLIIKERYKSEHAITANEANIIITNSEIKSSENIMVETYGSLIGAELNLHIRDNSVIAVNNSAVYGRVSLESSSAKISNSTVSYVYWTLNSSAEINDSTLGSFVFDCKAGIPGKMLLEGLKKDEETNFIIKDLSEGGYLKINNTNVKYIWSFNLEWACGKELTIKDSDFDLVWIKFPPTDNQIKINGLPAKGLIREFDLKDAVSGIALPYNVEIFNTNFDKFKPEMLGTKAEITNSYAMVHPYDTADLIIKDSTLFSFFNYGSKRIEFLNVKIFDNLQLIYKPELANGMNINNKIVGQGGYFDFVFDKTTIDAPQIVIANMEGKINGDLTITSPKTLNDIQWVKGIITRAYPIIAEPNADIKLWEGDTLKWAGKTDGSGETSFGIVFDKENYTKEFAVEAEGVRKKVNFLSNTPIVFETIDKLTGIQDGDLIRNPNAPGDEKFDVYIAKIIGEKKFKRLILSPHVFESYGHLSWDKIKDADQKTIDEFRTSDLVRCFDLERGTDDPKVYKLIPSGDQGARRHLNLSPQEFEAQGYDWDSIYIINKIDRDVYAIGEDITLSKTPKPAPAPKLLSWQKETGIRVPGAVSSCAVFRDNQYRMYYTGIGGIYLTRSSDGLNFQEYGQVTANGPFGSEQEMVTNPAVFQLKNGKYRMIYEGSKNQQSIRRLYSAVSDDGLKWTEESGIRLEDSIIESKKGTSQETIFTSVPDVIRLDNDCLRMYYTVIDESRIAESCDEGLTWQKIGKIMFDNYPEVVQDPDIIRLEDRKYKLFFSTQDFDRTRQWILSAESDDGINFKIDSGERINPSPGNKRAVDPDVINLPSGKYRMYFGESSSWENFDIFSAISSD